MNCIIIANGNMENYNYFTQIIKKHDYIICADGGARHLLAMDILPHVILGDLDSIDESIKQYYEEKKVLFYKFPSRKDFTDTELAIEYAVNNNAKEITILGAIGSRMDHTLANIALLVPLMQKGIKARIINEHNEIMIANQAVEIEGNPGDYLSIIPLEMVEGVTLRGLEYPLHNATVNIGSSIGISNRFKDDTAKISFSKGMLIIIKAKD